MIGMFRRRVMLLETGSGSGGGLQDGFYFKDIMLDIPEDTYESGSALGPGCVAITYEGPRDFSTHKYYCDNNAIGFYIWAVKNGSPIPSSQLTITTTGYITSADLAISDNEPSDYIWGTHWLSGSHGMLDLGSNDTITISCPQYNYSLVITFDFYQEIVFSDTTKWVDNECSCRGTIDYFNVSSSVPYTTLTVHVPQYYKTDNYDAISSMTLTLAYCRENEGVKRLKMDSNNYFTVNSSSLIGDTADYKSLGITHSIGITPVSEMSPNSSTTLTFRDYSSNTVVFTAVIYNDINTGNSHGGSGGDDNHAMQPVFVTYSNGQFDLEYDLSNSGTFRDPSEANTGRTFVKYVVGSSDIGLLSEYGTSIDGYTETFGLHNEWIITVSILGVNSHLTSLWNQTGEFVYNVQFNVKHTGSWASSDDASDIVEIYSGLSSHCSMDISVGMT